QVTQTTTGARRAHVRADVPGSSSSFAPGCHPCGLPPRRTESRDLDDLRTRLVLTGAPPSALAVYDPASIEQLASPDAPWLPALDRALHTREAERARLADRLGL